MRPQGPPGGRGAVLLPDHFKLDAGVDRDLVARSAVFRPRDLIEVAAFDMDLLPRTFFLRRGFDLEVILLGNHFRHAFASRMLQRGQSLKTIADLLGHRHFNTTFIYTKVDLETLRQLPLDWPKEVS